MQLVVIKGQRGQSATGSVALDVQNSWTYLKRGIHYQVMGRSYTVPTTAGTALSTNFFVINQLLHQGRCEGHSYIHKHAESAVI